MLEAYEAYGDYDTMAELARTLVQAAAYSLNNSHVVTHADGTEYDLGGQWAETTLYGALSAALGEEVTPGTPMSALLGYAAKHDVAVDPLWGPGKLAEELFEIRLSIEPMAARLAAQRGTTADHAAIRAAFVRMSQAHVGLEDAIEADIDFHLQILQAEHNRFLLPISSVVRAALSISIPRTMAASGGFGASLNQHEAILTAIERREGEAALAAGRVAGQCVDAVGDLRRVPRLGAEPGAAVPGREPPRAAAPPQDRSPRARTDRSLTPTPDRLGRVCREFSCIAMS